MRTFQSSSLGHWRPGKSRLVNVDWTVGAAEPRRAEGDRLAQSPGRKHLRQPITCSAGRLDCYAPIPVGFAGGRPRLESRARLADVYSCSLQKVKPDAVGKA